MWLKPSLYHLQDSLRPKGLLTFLSDGTRVLLELRQQLWEEAGAQTELCVVEKTARRSQSRAVCDDTVPGLTVRTKLWGQRQKQM